jgi:uncharacterized protein with PIN domain
VEKADIAQQLPPRTSDLHTEFRRCPTCGRVYWKGSHYDRMRALIDSVQREAG